MTSTAGSATTARHLRIRSNERALGLKDGEHLGIPELEMLIAQGARFLEDCGPFDVAYEHLNNLQYRYCSLRYQMLAEQFQIDPRLQGSMESALGQGDRNKMFDFTDDELLDIAGAWENKASLKNSPFDKKISLRMRDTVLLFIEWRAKTSFSTETRQ